MSLRSLAKPAGLVLALCAAESTALTAPELDLQFRVLLDGKEIGTHSFRVDRREAHEVVEIDAAFKVSFLGITVYRYRHSSREIWRDGCLESIDSVTEDGGDDFRVKGSSDAGSFALSTLDGEFDYQADCVMTFAYWRRDFLDQASLLNAQNGDYLPVEVEPAKREALEIDGKEVDAERYRLRGTNGEIDISVWYDPASGRWMSLESRLEGGRVIRYLPLEPAGVEPELPRAQAADELR